MLVLMVMTMMVINICDDDVSDEYGGSDYDNDDDLILKFEPILSELVE